MFASENEIEVSGRGRGGGSLARVNQTMSNCHAETRWIPTKLKLKGGLLCTAKNVSSGQGTPDDCWGVFFWYPPDKICSVEISHAYHTRPGSSLDQKVLAWAEPGGVGPKSGTKPLGQKKRAQ